MLCIARLLLVLIFIITFISCHSSKKIVKVQPDSKTQEAAPVLSPKASIKAMQVENGFEVKLVASEPLISNPVDMAFDDSLHLWVVEMNGFRPIKDEKDRKPLGKVVILSDTNGDGKMDGSNVFLDSLNMPRAICLIGDGILLATPPDLWYIENNHGRPGKKILVDSAYTIGQNVEAQTNGLLRSLDNWIYDAGYASSKRYRKINGRWHIEKTRIRGQWGISQDNYGRLYYNHNTQNLLGDYFMPGLGTMNKAMKKVAGYNETIAPDTKVYPIRPTPGVNRGYRQGVLDDSLKLVNFTAASGPVIYRGGTFGNAYEKNAFVCEPAANLIKRDILKQKGYKMIGKEAYHGKEFLASTDQRFRPVNLYNGPDGALYVVDMYRGVIQDSLSLTNYLRSYSITHKLVKPADYGRIYKIVPKGKKDSMVAIPDNPEKLVSLLKNPNGWVRDHAQQKLIDEGYTEAIPALRKLLQQKAYPLAAIHALWTLEGLNALKPDDIIPPLKRTNWHIQMEALSALIATVDKSNYRKYAPVLDQLISQKDSLLAPYVARAINSLYPYAPQRANQLLSTLIPLYSNNSYVTDAVISGLHGPEMMKYLKKFPNSTMRFHKRLATVLQQVTANREELIKKKKKEIQRLKKKYPEGVATFNAICQTCHGADGNGIEFSGPPLNGSEWVTGNRNKSIAIVLYGIRGPIEVGGKIYKKPEISGSMPPIGHSFSDKKIAEILSFIRKMWDNNASEVHINDVKKVRRRFKNREKAFTAGKLNRLFAKDKK
jgi:mono/diheme cytochrome c family protein